MQANPTRHMMLRRVFKALDEDCDGELIATVTIHPVELWVLHSLCWH